MCKPLFGRTLGPGYALAYPSGHVTGATAVALVVVLAAGREHRSRAAAAGGVLVAVACWGALNGGGHVASDVLGGVAAGVVGVSSVALALDRLR